MKRCSKSLIIQFSSVQFSHSVVSDSLRPHESQHTRPPCPPPTPGVYSNSCPSSQWCHPAISSSIIPFSSCPQSLPASGSFPMSHLFTWDGQSIGVSLIIRELKIKSTVSYHLLSSRTAIIKKSTNNKSWRRCGEKGTSLSCWWECKLVQSLGRTVWRFPRKIKIELSYDPAIPLLGIYLDKIIIQKDTCITMFIAALFTIAKTWKQPKCPSTEEWINKM